MFEAPSVIFAAAGLAVFAAALLPKLLRKAPLSMPMVFLAAGILAFTFIPELPDPDPLQYGEFTTHLTEICVIISLMGAGLALDRPVGRRSWSTTWRMLGVAMPICIVALTLLGLGVLGLGLGAALLVGAALAPTDPVLASEVQVGEPADDEDESEQGEDEIRFGLTSEAGLNDGLAFPFVYLAIAISLVGPAPSEWFVSWFATDVVWRIGMGVLLGWLAGKALSMLFFSARDSIRLSSHSEGFVALAATFLAYGVTEMLEGYGFIAVFVCAVTIRAAERTHGFHRVMHSYVEQLERLMTVVILVLLGGAIARGLLAGIGWAEILVALTFLLVVRPLAGWIGLARGKTGPRERIAIAFFGIRGIGSLYYLAYALSKGDFDAQAEQLWAFIGLVVAMSIVLHGATTAPVMNRLDRLREQKAVQQHGDGGKAPKTPI